MASRKSRTDDAKRLRRCIVSGALRPKEEMIRFVIGPDGDVVADLDGSLPGRGLWLSAERDMINTACARKVFARAAGAPLTAPPGMADRVEGLLARRCLDLVGLACRAGQAVAGFDRTRAWLRAGKGGGIGGRVGRRARWPLQGTRPRPRTAPARSVQRGGAGCCAGPGVRRSHGPGAGAAGGPVAGRGVAAGRVQGTGS